MQHLEHWTLLVKVTTAPAKKVEMEKCFSKALVRTLIPTFDIFCILFFLIAFASFLVIKERKKLNRVAVSIVNHTADNLAFFHHGPITLVETAIIRFYSPNIFGIAVLWLLLLDIVLSLYSLCSWRHVPTESLSSSLKMHFIVHQTSRNQTQFPKWPQPAGVLSQAEKKRKKKRKRHSNS